eukprot:snap_masked-scaffold_7-processed-gene-13.35-mRNA-1 protein AED:1.00 eAED:1.00 QI:0/-1/0/0/-1/1/1/0/59
MTDALKQTASGDFFDVDMSLSQHSGLTILSPRKRKVRKKKKRCSKPNQTELHYLSRFLI